MKLFPTLLVSALAITVASVTYADLKNQPSPKPGDGAKAVSAPYDFDYQFGRPVKSDEMTYQQYRDEHAAWAEKHMNVKANAVADGMDTWHWWVGVDNPGFWQDLVNLSGGTNNDTRLRIDFLRLVMAESREARFKKYGLVNDPDTVPATEPDQFGMKIDRMKDGSLTWDPEKFGYSSGVIGLQLFKNKDFDPKNWSAEQYLKDPRNMQAPYKIGMSCAFCHIGFDPNHPPIDPANPKWENLNSVIGDQYLREGEIFGGSILPSSIVYQYMSSQEPGTSETSRFPYDHINNPTNINTILRLQDRLKVAHVENITPAQAKMAKSMYANAGLQLDNIGGALGGSDDHPTMKVPHILTDGADSMGILMASVRVYVNEGMMHKDWYDAWPINPWHLTKSVLHGFKGGEFDIINKERKDPNSPWMQTERRMPNMATFLMSYDSFPLADTKEGRSYLSAKPAVLNRGKVVFAENCASCHSSKRPDESITDPAKLKQAWHDIVMKDDFLVHNYLSDDERHSVTEIGTNIQRAEGSNAQEGNTWGQMSSQTYKDQRHKQITLTNLYNPLTEKFDLTWKGTDAYYRTPTLVSIWATSPYFHNNSLGKYAADPSIKARMEGFEDGMEKLLWPEKRLGVKSIKVTTTQTSLPDAFPGLTAKHPYFDKMKLKLLQLPAGTPINLLLSVNPKYFPSIVAAYVKGVLAGKPDREFSSLIDRRREAGIVAVKKKLLEVNTAPDFIEDRGHEFGSKLADEDKRALIEYMKTF